MKEKDEEELEDEEEVKTKLIIQGDDYQLKNVDVSPSRWNLYLLRKKKKDGSEYFKNEAYGVTITQAMIYIINYRIAKLANGKALKMVQYLKLWKKMLEILRKELHGL